MVSPTITTVVKMLESLPEATQSRAVEHLREWLADLEDENTWDDSFAKSQGKLYEVARQARRQIAEGKAKAMDINQL